MESDPSIESKNLVARFTGQPDGLLVLAYDGEAGGCGVELTKLLEEIAKSLPVLVVQAGDSSSQGEAPPFQGKVSRALTVPHDSGSQQNAAIALAMRELGIRSPILVLVNPLFVPFWERAFGVYRLFVVTQSFKRETEIARQEDEGFDSQQKNRILLLERSVNSILIEDDGDLEWMRDEFVYRGESHPVKELRGSVLARLLEFSTNALGKENRFPHRLDILILIDKPDDGQDLPLGAAASCYHRTSRHHVYFALKRADEESGKITEPPDYSGFDVLLIELPGDLKRDAGMDPQVTSGVNHFRGLKGFLASEENWADGTLADLSVSIGAQTLVSREALEKGQSSAEALDAFFSSLMPGLPNWQLHQAGKFLPHTAWTYRQLLGKQANGNLDLESLGDPIGELWSLDLQKQKLEKELDEMRGEIASQDALILDLGEKLQVSSSKPPTQRKPGFLKKILSGIKGNGKA